MVEKDTGYRLNTGTFFLTYPQCPLTHQVTLEKLRLLLKDITEYIVA